MYPYIYILGKEIGTYGICMVLGFCTVYYLALRRGKRKGLIYEDLLIVTAFVLGFALLGGSLLYTFVSYTPVQIWTCILEGKWEIFGSGIVFYGGLIGGLAGALLGVRVAGCGLDVIEESVVPYIPLGHAIGRCGCLLAGCCYGFEYQGPLALHYPNSVAGLSPEQGYFPVQLLESVVNIGICGYLIWYSNRNRRTTDILFTYLGIYAVCRYCLEFLRGDAVRGLWGVFSTSQIVSILLFIISIGGKIYNRKIKKPHC